MKAKDFMTNPDLVARVDNIEKRLDEHIHDGIDVWKGLEGVRTDITWIKRALWVLVTLGLSFNGLLVKFMLNHIALKVSDAIMSKVQ